MRVSAGMRVAGAVLGLSVLVQCGTVARADDASVPELQEQIRRLQKQVDDLAILLKGNQNTASSLPGQTGTLPPPNVGLQKDDVRAIVADYIKNTEDKKAALPKQSAEQGFTVGSNLGMTTYWKNGLFAETADKAFKVHVGGRTQWDAVWYDVGDAVQFGKGGVGRVQDGVNPRRARLEVDGTFYEVIDFFCEYEFLGNTFNTDPTLPATDKNVTNTPGPTDLWVTLTHIPWIGNFRVGNMKPRSAWST
jgi:hypothetical protein